MMGETHSSFIIHRSSFADASPIPAEEVVALFSAFDKASRAHRLYAENNPVYRGFHSTLSSAFGRLWDRVASLPVTVEEHALRCFDQAFDTRDGRDDLAFLFYKDGIRQLTFLPGFEHEVEQFLRVVDRARRLDTSSIDDMVTLLWEQELSAFQYSYVDVLADGLVLPRAEDRAAPISLDPAALHADAAGDTGENLPSAVAAGAPTVARAMQARDFNETAYFLDAHELEALEREVERESRRDTRAAVLDALFDRLEDGGAERQLEIVRILRQLMPVYLSGGDLASASRILAESSAILESGGMEDRAAGDVKDLFRELSEPSVLRQLLASLSDGAIDPAEVDLQVFLSHLDAAALPLLIHAAEAAEAGPLQARLRAATEGLAHQHRDVLLAQIGSPDTLVTLGATRLAGQLGLGAAVPRIATLLTRPEPQVRRAAVDALIEIRSGAALAAVQQAVEDEDRDVRMAAARGLGSVRYPPARPRLEQVIQSKRLAGADLSEQIAFFEAFGEVATAENVKLLDRMLNARRLIGRPSAELRACAAMALGKVRSPASRAALEQAAQDPNPMVRNAVARALGTELPAR